MDFSAVGQKIKELRKQMRLSQEELAEGICTQAQISKIEKGDVYPYASTLYLISQRLGVDVNYFFDIGMTPRLDYVEEVIHQLKKARRNMQFEEMYQIVKTEEKNPLFIQNKRNQQLLLWHKGIYEYESHRDLHKAIRLIKEAIALTQHTEKVYSEIEIELISSIGVIYVSDKQYDKAYENYKNGLKHLEALPYLKDKTIKTRLFYNFARLLTRMDKYDDSITYCHKTINWCLTQDLLYVLPEIHYHLGYNLELKGEFQEAKIYMEKSIFLFMLQNDHRYSGFIQEKLLKWKIENKIK